MKINTVGISLCILALLLAFSVLPAHSQEGAEIIVHSGGIYVNGGNGATYLLLRVAGSGGALVADETSDGGAISWTVPGGLPDGQYTYEVRQGFAPKRTRDTAERNGSAMEIGAVETQYPVWNGSGGFLLQGGGIVISSQEETGFLEKKPSILRTFLSALGNFLVTPAYADQVILDDLIIDGSVCAGFDCVDGESFGFDTLRLKENNLRIKFEDTSASASFPSNDWQITVNDSSNGGINKFSIDDIDGGKTPFTIEAGAASNSLYVDDAGKVGLGTATPVVELHLTDSDTPTMRLEQDGSSGFTPQTWDVAGNETNFFVRDATNSSKLPFKIIPNTATNTLYLKGDPGTVGINTTSPDASLHVVGNARIGDVDDDPVTPQTQTLYVVGDALISGNLELGSSRTLKNNIRSLQLKDAEMTLAALQPVRFHYKNSPKEESLGFIAEEVPALVATQSRRSISTMDVVAVLTKVMQEQQLTISRLESKISALEIQNVAQ